MSQTFSYEMWVPRERLFDAVALIAERDQSGELSSRVWPDGRPLRESADASTLEPVRFGDYYNFAFLFPADEELREFNQRWSEKVRDQNAMMWKRWKARTQTPGLLHRLKQWLIKPEPTLQDLAEMPAESQEFILTDHDFHSGDGLYCIPQIETTFGAIYGAAYEGPEWLDGEEDLVLIRFSGGYSDMSHLMSYSPSIRRWFLDFAREMGAFSCVFDWEGPGKLLYLRGEEFDVNYDENENTSPFGLAGLVGRPQSENARRMSDFGRWTWKRDKSPTQGDELLRATRDVNSGIRSKALRALSEWNTPAGDSAIEAALDDADARVRELAVTLYTMVEGSHVAPLVRLMNTDENESVRLQAIRSLGELKSSEPILRELLLQTPQSQSLESFETAFFALEKLQHWSGKTERVPLLSELLARPEFPFREWAQARLSEVQE